MSFAHVDSVDALKEFRSALWKFADSANQSLSEADADLQRTLSWLEHDARAFWQGQIRRRTKELARAKEALSAKTAISRRDGTKPSAIEEQNAVAKARNLIEDAEKKLERVKQYAKVFQREALQYRGLMQRFANAVQVEIPQAANHLDGLIGSLASYTAPEEAGSSVEVGGSEAPTTSMKRPEVVEAPAETQAPAPSPGETNSQT